MINQPANTTPKPLSDDQLRSKVSALLTGLRHAYTTLEALDTALDDTQADFRQRRANVAAETLRALDRVVDGWGAVRETVAATSERK